MHLYAQELLGYSEINTVFWMLCYEIQFYLVFALLLSARSVKLMVAAFVEVMTSDPRPRQAPIEVAPDRPASSLKYGELA